MVKDGYACPDCNAPVINGALEHEATCPLEARVSEVCESDREWFEKHPGAAQYFREIATAEVVEIRPMLRHSPDCAASGRVMVTRLTDVLRSRDFRAIEWSCQRAD